MSWPSGLYERSRSEALIHEGKVLEDDLALHSICFRPLQLVPRLHTHGLEATVAEDLSFSPGLFAMKHDLSFLVLHGSLASTFQVSCPARIVLAHVRNKMVLWDPSSSCQMEVATALPAVTAMAADVQGLRIIMGFSNGHLAVLDLAKGMHHITRCNLVALWV